MRFEIAKLLFVSLLSVTVTACASWPSPPLASGIDAAFRLKKLEPSSRRQTLASPGVRAYQLILSQTLGSHCRYFPSDSRYQRLVAERCGPMQATVRAMGRFLLEYDAPKLGRPVLLKNDGVFYEDLPTNCGWI